MCQKAPSAKRCIKTHPPTCAATMRSGQKAPSAKRCIKTRRGLIVEDAVGESESTERQKVHYDVESSISLNASHACQKAPSAKGALRHGAVPICSAVRLRQKAPSAKRCIKTGQPSGRRSGRWRRVRRHRAPKGALRLAVVVVTGSRSGSESTERQKVH